MTYGEICRHLKNADHMIDGYELRVYWAIKQSCANGSLLCLWWESLTHEEQDIEFEKLKESFRKK